MSTKNVPEPARPVRVVGILGGIGSGKSTVAAQFVSLGAEVFDADAVVHKLLKEKEIKEQVVAEFGAGMVAESGELDREALRDVFRDADRLQRLTAVLHPPVLRAMESAVSAARERGEPRVLVLDVPLLLETGTEGLADRLVFVDAPREIRLRRLAERSGLDEAEVARREKLQTPINFKRDLADYKVDSSTSRDDTMRQVQAIWRDLLDEPAAPRG